MNQIDNSLSELEKAKQEILDRLKELEKMEESLKKQMEENAQKSVPSEEKKSEVLQTQQAEESQKAEPIETPPAPETKSEKISETPKEPEPVAANIKEETNKTSQTKAAPQKLEKTTKVESKQHEKDLQKIALNQKKKDLEKKQIENFEISVANRIKGKVAAEPGNIGIKHTHCEVFVFIVDDNELQLKVLQEQFKNTRSFKKTKGFTNGKDLLDYIKTRKFPKKSIFLVVMDYFLEDSDDEEAQNGIAVLNDLKAYDPNIEVIMLSSHSDVDIAASASYFGAVTFIQKGKDAFKKILNNMVWAIHEQEKIRKKADTKRVLRIGIIVFISIFVVLITIDFFFRNLGIFPVPTETL